MLASEGKTYRPHRKLVAVWYLPAKLPVVSLRSTRLEAPKLPHLNALGFSTSLESLSSAPSSSYTWIGELACLVNVSCVRFIHCVFVRVCSYVYVCACALVCACVHVSVNKYVCAARECVLCMLCICVYVNIYAYCVRVCVSVRVCVCVCVCVCVSLVNPAAHLHAPCVPGIWPQGNKACTSWNPSVLKRWRGEGLLFGSVSTSVLACQPCKPTLFHKLSQSNSCSSARVSGEWLLSRWTFCPRPFPGRPDRLKWLVTIVNNLFKVKNCIRNAKGDDLSHTAGAVTGYWTSALNSFFDWKRIFHWFELAFKVHWPPRQLHGQAERSGGWPGMQVCF